MREAILNASEINVGIASVFLCFSGFLIAVLTHRIVTRRIEGLAYLLLSFLAMILAQIFAIFDVSSSTTVEDLNPPFYGPIAMVAWSMRNIFVLLFVKATFYKKRPVRKLFASIVLAIGLFGLLSTMRLASAFVAIKIFDVIAYTLLAFLVIMSHGWLALESSRLYHSIEDSVRIDAWIKIRYKVVSFTAWIPAISSIPPIFMAFAGISLPWTIATYIAIFICNGIFIITSVFCWATPDTIKRRWNENIPVNRGLLANGSLVEKEEERETIVNAVKQERFLTSRGIIMLIEIAGEFLATSIGKDPSACKGLLVLTISAELGSDRLYAAHLSDIIAAMETGLSDRLSQVGQVDAREVVDATVKEIIKKQSLLTIGNA